MYKIKFFPQILSNQIICGRVEINGGAITEPVVYTQNGIQPALFALELDEQCSWKQACKILGWAVDESEGLFGEDE